MNPRWFWGMVVLVAVLGGASGCGEDKVGTAPSGAPAVSAAAVPDRKELLTVDAGAPASSAGLPRIDFQEVEFGESERSRDPFRSYLDVFVAESRSTAKSQREVVLEDFSLDELKLVGIVTGVADARAMLVDPHGRGHVVRRGQFVGRAEIVRGDSKGAPAFEINWRIDRIREGDIVLVREDPKNPEVPSATRVIALRPDTEGKDEKLTSD
jgi:type IV pilus assembly protein PilP